MKTFEFKSAICTSHEQSEKLLALGLKRETADMVHCAYSVDSGMAIRPFRWLSFSQVDMENFIPAWSLHRLLFLIPKEVNIDGFKFPLRADVIMRLEDADFIYARLIGVIERVIKEGYFNKDYLEEKE